MRNQLSICTYAPSDSLSQSLVPLWNGDRYTVSLFQSKQAFLNFVEHTKQSIDCLILQDSSELCQIVEQLQAQSTLLPLLIVKLNSLTSTGNLALQAAASPSSDYQVVAANLKASGAGDPVCLSYLAAVQISAEQLHQVSDYIEQAITQFIKLSPEHSLIEGKPTVGAIADQAQNILMIQQQRLAEKLKERLGYLGVYYKRDPKNFLRHLPKEARQELLDTLKSDYREIILSYFSKLSDSILNQKIDEFVNAAFFADIPVAQIVEIHMELMDEFSKQLKLEGRSEEVLLDYRLTLIDTIAHLCEMYRRSIPKEP